MCYFKKGGQMNYYLKKEIDLPYEEAIERAKSALKEEGFGVLTEIDVKKTLKEKLNVDVRPYIILGACNPPFAYKALEAEPEVGVLLPCNLIVRINEKEKTEIILMNPEGAMSFIKNEKLEEISKEVTKKLKNVIEKF